MRSGEKKNAVLRAWAETPPGRFIGPGHPIGDFLEAPQWELLEERSGYVKVYAHLPLHVRNLRGQLFGGFTGTYVDFISLYTVRAGRRHEPRGAFFLATTNMRLDYFEPITEPGFTVESTLVREHGSACFAETRFFSAADRLAVFALTSMKKLPL